jgi:hypothetical protein
MSSRNPSLRVAQNMPSGARGSRVVDSLHGFEVRIAGGGYIIAQRGPRGGHPPFAHPRGGRSRAVRVPEGSIDSGLLHNKPPRGERGSSPRGFPPGGSVPNGTPAYGHVGMEIAYASFVPS